MQLDKRKDIGTLLNNLNLTRFGVEVGVWKGANAEDILSTWKGKKLYLVDAWRRKFVKCLYATQKRLKQYENRVEYVKQLSLDAVKMFEDEFFDFIYIDAAHDYKSVNQDIRAWYPKCKSGGLFSGHDYIPDGIPPGLNTNYGVKSAVDGFTKEINVEINVTNDKETFPSWWFIKP